VSRLPNDALVGDVLELGSGSGANAVELLDRYPAVVSTHTAERTTAR
jgi:hypothetical protein